MQQPILSREELRQQPDSEQEVSGVLPRSFFSSGQPSPQDAPTPAPSGPPAIQYNFGQGANVFTRGRAELMSDNPEELQLWAQRNYGDEAAILRGSQLGFPEDSPEYNATFLSRGFDQPFEVFDPTQSMAAGDAGIGGRLAEIAAEIGEVGMSLAPELAVEAGLLAATRGRTLPGALGKISQLGGWRARGASRAGYFGGVSGGAALGSSALQQIMQDYGGTQTQTRDEQISSGLTDAAIASGFSLGGSVLKFGGYLGIDALLGQTSEQGARTLQAASEFNRRARAGEDVAEILPPLVASTSNNPLTRQTYNFLSRMSPEFAEYNQRIRASLLDTARRRAGLSEGEFALLPEEEIRTALEDQYNFLRSRIMRPVSAADSHEAGVEAAAYLSAFADETYTAASNAYNDVFQRMQAEGGDYLDLQYDFSSLRDAIRNGRERRVLARSVQQEDTGQPGLEVGFENRPIQLEPGEAAAWSTFNDVTGVLEGLTRGNSRVPPETIVRLIQNINDQLSAIGPDATDAGVGSLRRLKRGLNDALDSLPTMNEGRFSQETIDQLRSANTLFRNRAEMLDSAGVMAIMRHGEAKDYAAAAATLYNGNLSTIRNVRDAVLQTEGGRANWDQMRNNYLAYALNAGDEASPFARWQSLPSEVKGELFSVAERTDIAQNLRQLDALVNDTGFREVIDAADETGNFLSTLFLRTTAGRTGRPRAVEQVGEALRRANINGNQAPQRAFTAGVWDHLLRQSGVVSERAGETSINSRAFNRELEKLDRIGVLDLLSSEDRQFMNEFVDILRPSDVEIGSSGSSIAVAGMVSELAGGQNLASNMGRILSSKLASNALILGNRGLQNIESAIGGRRGVNVQTSLARIASYYAFDQNQVSSQEWQDFERSLSAVDRSDLLSAAQR